MEAKSLHLHSAKQREIMHSILSLEDGAPGAALHLLSLGQAQQGPKEKH